MSDLSYLKQSREEFRARWKAERADAVEKQAVRKFKRRRTQKRMMLVSGLLLVSGLAAQMVFRQESHVVQSTTVAQGDRRWSDGSVAWLTSNTDLVTETETAEKITHRLRRGRARFEVTHKPQRIFRVDAENVSVEVLGTIFTVERDEATQNILVSVERGLVRVRQFDQEHLLRAGQSLTFTNRIEEPVPPPSFDEAPPPATITPSRKNKPSKSSATQLSVAELWQQVDLARQEKQADVAVKYLQQLIERFPNDSRAALAAMTLGRIFLDDLHKPEAAAQAFARVEKLSGHNNLAEDALARRAEAYKQAGRPDQSRAAATLYLERYARGAHRARMERLLAE